MIVYQRNTSVLGGIAAVAFFAAPSLGHAQQQDYDFDIKRSGKAVVIEQDTPRYPGRVRRGQEGWVRMSYVVTPDGRAIDPIIIDSSGGVGFEHEARRVAPNWRFEPGDVELPYNFVDIRTEIQGGRDAATSGFMRRSKRIMMHLFGEEVPEARKAADDALRINGWNLYESTMLWLMLGRVDGAEQNPAGQLEMYRRALAMGNKRAIRSDDEAELLEKIFVLEANFQQYAAALSTRKRLSGVRGSEEAMKRTAERALALEASLTNDAVTVARATIFNPCDCDDGEPLWHYAPARRTFSFANIGGAVEKFEARCQGQRISGAVETGREWTLDEDWGYCQVFVFGEDGATFDFLEHASAGNDDKSTDSIAIARNHVLDSGNPGQRGRR